LVVVVTGREQGSEYHPSLLLLDLCISVRAASSSRAKYCISDLWLRLFEKVALVELIRLRVEVSKMTAEEDGDGEMHDYSEDGVDADGKKQKRSKPRRQSGTAVAFQKRASIRKTPERTTSSHLVERKGKNALEALQGQQGGPKQDRRGSQGAIKAATSAMRAARGVPTNRGVPRAASSQQAPKRPARDVAPGKKSTPARSSSTHALKQVRKVGGQEPTLTGADLLSLRKAQKADIPDDFSVQSDVESTYTMDSINLRKSQIHHHDDDGKSTRIICVGCLGPLCSYKIRLTHFSLILTGKSTGKDDARCGCGR
jgi:hypothetical protein